MISSLLSKLAVNAFGAMISGFSWFHLLPGFSEESPSVGHSLGLKEPADAFIIPTAWAVVGVIILLALVARMGLQRAVARGGTLAYVPDAGLTVRNAFEVVIEWLYDLAKGLIGEKEAMAFFPLIATLFVYLLFANLSGFIPGMLPPTENFSHNFALALCVFVVFNYVGFARNGVGYLKHLGGPVWWLAPFFFVLETISLLIRPMSLSIRLTVNIFVDHLLGAVARGLGQDFLGTVGAMTLPVPLYFLGLMVCVVQAFVFALLTIIYISLSVGHAHADEHSPAHH
jgi:F-type H+-transporting ATPase subunit a